MAMCIRNSPDPSDKPHTMWADDFDALAFDVGEFIRRLHPDKFRDLVECLDRIESEDDWCDADREKVAREFYRTLSGIFGAVQS